MKKLVQKYRNKDLFSLNCAEAILYAANEHYNLDLSEKALKLVSGFGGGVKEGHLCGIISGSVAVLSILFKGKELNEEDLLTITVNEFNAKFKQKYNKLDCDYLIEHYKEEELGCNNIIFTSSEILQDVIDKYM